MCGIAGTYAYAATAPALDREELLRIRDAMHLRGPDGAGLWISPDQRAGLAHRRLSIIDLSDAGAQPMSSADGNLHVTFNGEIYNYRELRTELEARGCKFKSASDTEVLLHLYAERGAEMVHALRGMYAFAVHDTRAGRLFLARDPFGIKPLYYADDGKTFRFASQVKALLKGGKVSAEPAPAGHVGFFIWGYVPEPHTLYRGIKALPAGSTLEIADGACGAPRAFFDLAQELSRSNERLQAGSREEAIELLRTAMLDSMRHHLVADVPVGLFLSAGMDSGSLAGFAVESGAVGLRTLTLGFDEYRGSPLDETTMAEKVSRCLNTKHQVRWIGQNDFEAAQEKLLEAMDQPSIDGVNTYFVSQAMAECGVKVALSGLGGDELFGGYPSFRDLPRIVKLFGFGEPGRAVGRILRKGLDPLLRPFTSPKFAGLLEYGNSFAGAYLLRRSLYMPWELPGFMDEDVVNAGLAELCLLDRLEESRAGLMSAHQNVSALELGWYMRNQLLRDSDWAGMAHSVEVRVPLVDVSLFRTVTSLITGFGLTKRDMAGLSSALPKAVREREKTGFSVPMHDWLRGTRGRSRRMRGLRGWAQKLNPTCKKPKRLLALLTDAYGGRGGISKFNRDFLEAVCSDPASREVVALPRVMRDPPGKMPDKLIYVTRAADGKTRFLLTLWETLAAPGRFDVILCCHINLLPVAWAASVWHRAPLILIIHGIDAWQPNRSRVTNFLVSRIDAFAAVSGVTWQRFLDWTGIDPRKGVVLPNSVDLSAYSAKPKNQALLTRFGLKEKRLLMTLGRLVSSERYKGFDEVIEAMPELLRIHPDLAYLIVGEGNDRARLEEKSRQYGVADHIVFAGYVAENEKCDYYNLADAFVMPSRGEGFGIVFLEAMACGVPVVGSLLDGSREALRDGMLGILVDPTDAASVRDGILEALQRPRNIPDGLEYFSVENFHKRTRFLLGAW